MQTLSPHSSFHPILTDRERVYQAKDVSIFYAVMTVIVASLYTFTHKYNTIVSLILPVDSRLDFSSSTSSDCNPSCSICTS